MHILAIAGELLGTIPPAGPADTVPQIMLGLAVIILGAKLGGEIFERIGQPAVLGELITGIILGNIHLIGITFFGFLRQETTFAVLAEIGVVLLLFEVGLETSMRELRSVGNASALVAVIGVVVPSAIGFGVSALFHPEGTFYAHLFVGAILCATSVGITARVLSDLKAVHRRESKIILGAAVIDDVLGLLILATVTAVIRAEQAGGSVNLAGLALIVGKALAFLLISILVGLWLSPRVFHIGTKLRSKGMLMALGLAFCFLLAYLAHRVGLAPIVGAFTAGLILEDVHHRRLATKEQTDLRETLQPITAFLVPVFFVLMGMRVDLKVASHGSVLAFAALLTAGAILGKQACALAVRGRGLDRLLVGIGMIPRGEVGLIFAGIGATLTLRGAPVVSPAIYSACVIMVMATTLATPPLLTWRLQRNRRPQGS